MMGAAVGVGTHLFEPADAVLPERIGHGDAHAGMVLVVAHALEFERLIVQEEALVRVKANRPEATTRDDLVALLAIARDAGSHFVQLWIANRPQLWRLDGDDDPGH